MITIDRITQNSQFITTTGTVDHNVPNQNSVVLIITAASGAAQTIQFNGNNVPILFGQSITVGYVVNPPVGTYPVTVIVANQNTTICILSISGVNLKQATPKIDTVTFSTSPPPTLLVSPAAANSLVIDSITYTGNPGDFTSPLSGQVEISNQDNSARMGVSYSILSSPTSLSWGYSSGNSGTGYYTAVYLEPAQSSSSWFPVISERTLGDIVTNNTTLLSGTIAQQISSGGATFYQNSFLHTVGRRMFDLPQAAPPTVYSSSMTSPAIGVVNRVIGY